MLPCGQRLCQQGKKTAQRCATQFPDVNSATAEVISRGAVVRTYCALHRHGLGVGSTVLYGELGLGQCGRAQSSSEGDDVKEGAR
jgi:hypothetical protein